MGTAKNDITGDFLVSGINSKEYTENFESIFPEKFGTVLIAGIEINKCQKRCWLESINNKPSCIKPGCKTNLT